MLNLLRRHSDRLPDSWKAPARKLVAGVARFHRVVILTYAAITGMIAVAFTPGGLLAKLSIGREGPRVQPASFYSSSASPARMKNIRIN